MLIFFFTDDDTVNADFCYCQPYKYRIFIANDFIHTHTFICPFEETDVPI